MDTSELTFGNCAGSFPWTKSGLDLLHKILTEIDNVGYEKMLAIVEEECREKAYVKQLKLVKRKLLTDADKDFLSKNWHLLKIHELEKILCVTAPTIRKVAYMQLNLSKKKYLAA